MDRCGEVVRGCFLGGDLEPGTFHHPRLHSVVGEPSDGVSSEAAAEAEAADQDKIAKEEGEHTQEGDGDNG